MGGFDGFEGGDDAITVDGESVSDTQEAGAGEPTDNAMKANPEFELNQDEDIQVGGEEVRQVAPDDDSEAPKDDSLDAGQPSEDEDTKPKGKVNKVQKRMDKLTREKYDAIRERDELKAELAKAKGDGNEPDPADFDDWDDYEAAMADHESKQNQESRGAETEAITDINQKADLWIDIPDDYAVLMGEGNFNLNSQTLIAVSEMDEAPQVMYHLAKNPDVADKLFNLKTETRLVKELDKIAESLDDADYSDTSSETPQAKRETQRAKRKQNTPIDPLGGAEAPQGVDLEKASFADFEKEMNKQENGNDRFGWN